MTAEKENLRKTLKQKREAYVAAQRELYASSVDISDALGQSFVKPFMDLMTHLSLEKGLEYEKFLDTLPHDAKSCGVGGYYPFGYEASPLPLMRHLKNRNFSLSLPKMHGHGNSFYFVPYDFETPLLKNSFNFYEPETSVDYKNPKNLKHDPALDVFPSLIFVPLLGVDQKGYRLGYGKGHYDRVMRDLRNKKEHAALYNPCHAAPLFIGLAFCCQQVEHIPHEDHDEKLDALLTPQRYSVFL